MAAAMKNTVDQLAEDFLSCALCLEHYKEPRSMDCLHTFCQTCLENHAASKGVEPGMTLNCPVCRQNTTVPDSGVEGLTCILFVKTLEDFIAKCTDVELCGLCDEEAPAVAICKDCNCSLCLDCRGVHYRLRIFKDHSVRNKEEMNDGEVDQDRGTCAKHIKPLDMYCSGSKCKMLVCNECVECDHNDHDTGTVSEKSLQYMAQLRNVQARLQCGKTIKENRVSSLNKTGETMKENADKLSLMVLKHTQHVIDEVIRERDVFLREIESAMMERQEQNDEFIQQLGGQVTACDGINKFLQHLIASECPADVVSLAPLALEKTEQVIQQGEGMEEPGEWKAPCFIPGTLILSEIRHMFGTVKFEKVEQDDAHIIFTPDGCTILASDILLREFKTRYHDDRLPSNYNPNNVTAVSCSVNGDIAVLDSTNQRLKLFSPDGDCKWATRVSYLAQNAAFVFWDASNKLYVATTCGRYALVETWGCVKSFIEPVNSIQINALDFKGNPAQLVGGSSSHVPKRVSMLKSIPSGESGKSLWHPMHEFNVSYKAEYIAVNKDNDAIVSSPGDKCIWKFTKDGEMLWKLKCSDSNGQTKTPRKVYTSHQGHIFVSVEDEVILIYSPQGHFMKQMTLPYGLTCMTFTSEGHMVVGLAEGAVRVYRCIK